METIKETPVKSYTSKVVLSIRQKQPFVMPGDDPTTHKKYIGSSLRGRSPLSGLTDDEERKYLPYIIGVSPKDVQWNQQVKNYWSNIKELVPADGVTTDKLQGRKIEFIVDFDKKSDKDALENAETFEEIAEITKKGTVVKGQEDYILFRYCLVYGKVANNHKDVNLSAKIEFYLYSTKSETRTKHKLMKNQLKAQAKFIEMINNEALVKAMILVYDRDLSTYEDIADMHLDLKAELERDPVTFLEHANNQYIGIKAKLKKAVNMGIVYKPANTDSYYYGENREVVLGHTIDEAVLFLASKNEETVDVRNAIFARLKNS